jgi:hypothetical protein
MLPPSDTPADPLAPPHDSAAERQKVLDADASRTWRGAVLKPWSAERARLLDALCAADVPMPDFASVDNIRFYEAYFARAVKALYLAHHEPRDWEPHRSRLLSVIDTWGVEHVPGDDIKEKVEAVEFVLEMEMAYQKVRAILRGPKTTAQNKDAGN